MKSTKISKCKNEVNETTKIVRGKENWREPRCTNEPMTPKR